MTIGLIVLELDPDTGRLVPVSPEQIREDYCGWTQPPEGFPRAKRRKWLHYRHDYIKAGLSAEMAWYRATSKAMSKATPNRRTVI